MGVAPDTRMACHGPRSPEVPIVACPQDPQTAHTGVPFFGFEDLISLLAFRLKMPISLG